MHCKKHGVTRSSEPDGSQGPPLAPLLSPDPLASLSSTPIILPSERAGMAAKVLFTVSLLLLVSLSAARTLGSNGRALLVCESIGKQGALGGPGKGPRRLSAQGQCSPAPAPLRPAGPVWAEHQRRSLQRQHCALICHANFIRMRCSVRCRAAAGGGGGRISSRPPCKPPCTALQRARGGRWRRATPFLPAGTAFASTQTSSATSNAVNDAVSALLLPFGASFAAPCCMFGAA